MFRLISLLPFFSPEAGGGGGAGAGGSGSGGEGGATGGAPAGGAPAGGAPAGGAPAPQSQAAAFNAANHIRSRMGTLNRPEPKFAGEAVTPAELKAYQSQVDTYNRTHQYRENFLNALGQPFSHGEGDNKLTYSFADAADADSFFNFVSERDSKGLTPAEYLRLYHFDKVHQGAYENGRKAGAGTVRTQAADVANAGGVAPAKPGERVVAPASSQKPKGEKTVKELFAEQFPDRMASVNKEGFDFSQ